METINEVTTLERGEIAIITLNSPPVNALSANVRNGLAAGFKAADEDPSTKAIVLICDGRTFIAGADITEFGKPGVQSASLQDVQSAMEDCKKPVIAAIHGTALGGGLEVALCAHYRVAVPSAKVGLPEVNLGLLPGAGGTQRLPRIVGAAKALEMMTTGQHVPAKAALAMGLVDELAPEGELRSAAIAFAQKIVAEKAYDNVGFTTVLGLKDANLALAAGENLGVPLPSGAVWRERLIGAIAHGDGEKDWSVVAREQARCSGME